MTESTPLGNYRRIHIVGAGGAGMSGLAKLLAQLGHQISGSDLKPSRVLESLGDLGIDAWVGHRPGPAPTWDLLVASSAVPSRDPEVEAARTAGVPVWGRPDLLDALTSMLFTIGIAGTHGKTTGTALAVTALRSLGRDPSFMVGGELVALNTNAHLGERDLFILEADEAFGTFEHLHLGGLVVTNVESDHLDHYGTLGQLEDSFAEVAGRVAGPLIVGIDDEGGRRLAARVDAVTYGTAASAHWRVAGVGHSDGSVRFTLQGPRGPIPVAVAQPGLHVARDAAGVLALLGELGMDVPAAAAGLSDFAGVRRRFEVRARLGGITVIDDYAHHPTEVTASLEAARLGPWGRIWAVFQPHRYSRTAEHAGAFGQALAPAQQVVVTDVYSAGEAPEPGVSGRLVADAVAAAGGEVAYVPLRRDLAGFLGGRLSEGDLVLLLGAGDITLVADELATLLGERR